MHIEAELACAERAQDFAGPLGEPKVGVAVIDQDRCKAVALPTEVLPLHPIVAWRRFSLLVRGGQDLDRLLTFGLIIGG